MKFLGIDLGWTSQASGLCCLEWQQNQLYLVASDRLLEIEAILAWCDERVGFEEPALCAVDAPTLIPNLTGMRLPDRLTHKYLGRYHAGCYPANLGRPFAHRTVAFGLSLEQRGYQHAPEAIARQLGRYQIEVYPHAAMVHLFALERILKYKKGRLADRRLELAKLQHYISEILPHLEPALNLAATQPLLESKLDSLGGKALKALEDRLDSLICAYVGAYWWYWGKEKNWVLGDRASGYIIVPAPT